MRTKLLLALFALALSITSAKAEVYSGTCGDNVNWTLDTDTGLLKIEGTGAMENFSSSPMPWENYRSYITKGEIVDGVTSIGLFAFYLCSSLTSITIPNSVTSIGDVAFASCSSLTSVTIGNGVTSIGGGVFRGCSSLTFITIPNSVTSIGSTAFDGCSNIETLIWGSDVSPKVITQKCQSKLKTVTLLDGVTSIGDVAFASCSSLTSITIPGSVTSIGNYAFSGCSSLTSITIPSSVTSIGGYVFCFCSSLTSITIPSSVTSIGTDAFNGCSGLTSITIPCSVTSIGTKAFDGCKLRTVVAKYVNPQNYSDAFSSNTYTYATLYVPEGTFWNYAYDCPWTFIHMKEMANAPAQVKTETLYMLADGDGLNYSVYDADSKGIRTIDYAPNLDEENLATYWQIQKNGSNHYLYSPAAGQYATMQNGKLQLTTAPAPIELTVEDGTIAINGTKCMLILNTEYDDPSAIDHIAVDEAKGDAPMYDLSGRKITHPTKGVFIQNGKKILVK